VGTGKESYREGKEELRLGGSAAWGESKDWKGKARTVCTHCAAPSFCSG